jgi:ribonuclease HI
VKVNVDGAFNQETGRAGIGTVIQNSAGVAIICAWKAIFDGMNAEEVEALAGYPHSWTSIFIIYTS